MQGSFVLFCFFKQEGSVNQFGVLHQYTPLVFRTNPGLPNAKITTEHDKSKKQTIRTVTACSFLVTLSILDTSFALKLPVALTTLERLSSSLQGKKMRDGHHIFPIGKRVFFSSFLGYETHSSSDLSVVRAVPGLTSGEPGRPLRCFTCVRSTSKPTSRCAAATHNQRKNLSDLSQCTQSRNAPRDQ